MKYANEARVFNKVREFAIARVKQAKKAGNIVERSCYMSAADGKIAVCALGAITVGGQTELPFNIDDDTWEPSADTIGMTYMVTAPILMSLGVREAEVGMVMDSIDNGFEGRPFACDKDGYPINTDKSEDDYFDDDGEWTTNFGDPKWVTKMALRNRYKKYYDLGAEIYKKYAVKE